MNGRGFITQYDVLDKAIHECLCELYKRAQPSINLNKLAKDSSDINYNHYYLSDENYRYIVNMYLDAYGLKSLWSDYCDTIKEYLTKGGFKDVFTVDNINKGLHKVTKEIPPLSELIGKENSNKAIEYINNCETYHTNHKIEGTFRLSVMNNSPTSNKQNVIDYWKLQGKDIKIKDYNIEEVYFKS